MPASPALNFDLAAHVTPMFRFSASTIWPKVNRLADEVDQIDQAADAAIAALEKLKGKTP